jgi:hypothetical protein
MSRLITFGCSYTYGEGLSDCLNPEINRRADFPSKFAWPSLLGKKLNKEVINLGRPGCSNRYIANEILNTSIEKDDLVVVLWTHANRSTIFAQGPDESQNLHPRKNDKTNRAYFKHIYNPYNCFLESCHSIHYSNLYLSSKEVTIYNFQIKPRLSMPAYATPKWNTVDVISQDLYYVDIANDGDHPGIESQKLIAQDMERCIRGN